MSKTVVGLFNNMGEAQNVVRDLTAFSETNPLPQHSVRSDGHVLGQQSSAANPRGWINAGAWLIIGEKPSDDADQRLIGIAHDDTRSRSAGRVGQLLGDEDRGSA